VSERIKISDVLIIILGIFILIVLIELYFTLNELISTWISYKYSPIYRALLNATILVVSLYYMNKLKNTRQKNKT